MALSTAAQRASQTFVPLAKRMGGSLLQNIGSGNVHSALGRSLTGRTYVPHNGRRQEFQALPSRTAAQMSTFGISGPMASSPLSGFGALNLDRGFRPVRDPKVGQEPIEKEVDEGDMHPLGPQWGGGRGGRRPPPVVATYARPTSAWAMPPAGGGEVIDATSREVGGDDVDWEHVASVASAVGSRVAGAAQRGNSRFNSTLDRPVVGRVVKAGLKATPWGRSALFMNAHMNARNAANAPKADQPF